MSSLYQIKPLSLIVFGANSLKQQGHSHVAPFEHIILNPSLCFLSGETTNAYFVVFDWTRPGPNAIQLFLC